MNTSVLRQIINNKTPQESTNQNLPTMNDLIEMGEHMAKVTEMKDGELLCMLVGVKTVKGVYASGGYKAIRKLKTDYQLRATPRASRLIMMAAKKKKTFKEWLVLRKL